MLPLIPECRGVQLYCQSALRTQTVLIHTDKDGKEQLQGNPKRILEELEDAAFALTQSRTRIWTKPLIMSRWGQKTTKLRVFHAGRQVRSLWTPRSRRRPAGGRDPGRCFCTHCSCKMEDPFDKTMPRIHDKDRFLLHARTPARACKKRAQTHKYLESTGWMSSPSHWCLLQPPTMP